MPSSERALDGVGLGDAASSVRALLERAGDVVSGVSDDVGGNRRQIYSITHSAYALGFVGLAQFLPMFVLTLVVGHVADRYDQRTIAYVCQAIEGIGALALCLGAWHGWTSVAPIYAIAVITGAACAFESPLMAALLPNLIPRSQLRQATAWSTSVNQTAMILGPAMGGLIYGLGALTVYGAVTIAFLATACAIAAIRIDEAVRMRAPLSFEALFSGIGFIRSKPVILGALSLVALAALGASDVISVVMRTSLVQLQTPDEMRGRVGAINSLFIGTSNQLGEFESGMTAGLFGAVPVVLIGGLGTIVVTLLWMRLFPALKATRSREG